MKVVLGSTLFIHLSFSLEIILPTTTSPNNFDQFLPPRILHKRAPVTGFKCSKPCQNGGICIRKDECACQPGFAGSQCEKKWDFCMESPISPVNSMVFLNKTHGKVMCVSGFKIDDKRNDYTIECIANSWVYDGKPAELAPQCLPTCKPECQNGGTCFRIDKCLCPINFGGDHCEKRVCSKEKPTMQQALENLNVHSLCPKGYTLDKTRVVIEVICQNSDWIIKYKQKHCEPICQRLCQNEGHCVGPNVCLCPFGYSGYTCGKKQCIDNPQNIRFINVFRHSLNLATLSCKDGYQLITGDTSIRIECQDGKWILPYSSLQCFPVCKKPCVNGGSCVAPDSCKCSEGFTGKYCEKRYFLTVSQASCIFPFEYKGQRFISCTMADRTFPWCATQVNKDGAVVTSEMCYADLGWTKLLETKFGVACFPPFQSETKKYFGCIQRNNSNASWCLADSSRLQMKNFQNINEPITTEFCQSESDSSALEEVIFLNNGEKCTNSQTVEADYQSCLESVNGKPSFCQDIYDKSNGQKFCLSDYGWKKFDVTKKGNSCVFPFSINGGLMVNHCVSLYNEPAWCATMVDTKGIVLEKEECIASQGYQYESGGHRMMFYAPSESNPNDIKIGRSLIVDSAGGRQCVFPLWHNNTLHFACISGKSEVPWCATKVNGREIGESDFCLPDLDFYNEELLKIEYGIRGFRNDEYMRDALEKVKNLNQKLLVYPKHLGYQRFLAMLMGERIYNAPPHKGPTLKYVNSDERLQDVIKNLPSEADLKDKGISEMLGLFGRRCCQHNKNQQVKVDFHRAQLTKETDIFLEKRNITLPDELLEAYAFVLRDLLESEEMDAHGIMKPASTPTYVEDSNITITDTTDLFETTTMAYNLNISQGIGVTSESPMKTHLLGDYFMPTSQSGERCQPFLLNGTWYGYGGCILREKGQFGCAVVTDHKGEAVRFEKCELQMENPGFWPPFGQNPTSYPQRNVMVTTTSELCFFPFKLNGNWHESCVQSENSPYGRCAISVDENWNPSDLEDCDPFEGTTESVKKATSIPSLSENSSEAAEIDSTQLILRGRFLMGPTKVTTSPSDGESPTTLSSQILEQSTTSLAGRITTDPSQNVKITGVKKEKSFYTLKGEKCMFPFNYKGVYYSECIIEDEVAPWCPTEISTDGMPLFGDYCQDQNAAKMKLHSITFSMDGVLCQFPFEYQGRIYHQCIESEYIRPWCKVNKHDGDKEGSRSECRIRGNKILAVKKVRPFYTLKGEKCSFPFKYKGIYYSECITEDQSFPWCPTEISTDGMPLFGDYCQGQNAAIKRLHSITFSMDGLLCQFPFEFQGRIYHHCIESEYIRPWCKVNRHDGNEDGSRSECRTRGNVILKAEHPLPRDVYTVSGKRCIFPFGYHENIHLECISDESLEGFWCATEIDCKGQVIAKETCATTKLDEPNVYSNFLEKTEYSSREKENSNNLFDYHPMLRFSSKFSP